MKSTTTLFCSWNLWLIHTYITQCFNIEVPSWIYSELKVRIVMQSVFVFVVSILFLFIVPQINPRCTCVKLLKYILYHLKKNRTRSHLNATATISAQVVCGARFQTAEIYWVAELVNHSLCGIGVLAMASTFVWRMNLL